MGVRRTAAETRELLLSTGVAMLFETGVTAGVGHIRLQEVVRRAGLTTGAAYRLWSDQSHFHRELVRAAARWRSESPLHQTVQAIRHVVDRRGPLDEVIRLGAGALIADMSGADQEPDGRASPFLTSVALRAGTRHDPESRQASASRHQESVGEFARLYEALMAVYGLRLRDPFTIEHFASAMAALGEGFALQSIEGEPHPLVDLPADDRDDPAEDRSEDGTAHCTETGWTLFAVCVRALVELFTEPAPPPAGGVPATDK